MEAALRTKTPPQRGLLRYVAVADQPLPALDRLAPLPPLRFDDLRQPRPPP